MTTFDNREQGYENKFAHDQETEFKILARMYYLLGQWTADKIQLAADAAENYAQNLVDMAVGKGGAISIKEQLQKDFSTAGIEISVTDIAKEMERLRQVARDQITNIG